MTRTAQSSLRAALTAGALAWALGCAEPHEPNYLFRGEWVDIDGQGRRAEETCGGTFAYVDAYAGALAREFGVEGHLGDYRWYSQERFDAEDACEGDNLACASDDRTLRTPFMPDNHELVHLATYAKVPEGCPKPLAEGIAEYNGPTGRDVSSNAPFEGLVAAFDDPTAVVPGITYGALGRFVAFLVERFGIDAVLEVCQASGRFPSAAQLSDTMDAIFGQSTAELLADFEPELGTKCDQSDAFQSRVFACGVAEAAPDIGLVGDEGVELRYEIDCASDRVIGPRRGRIWIIERLDLDQDDLWWVSLWGEDVDGEKIDIPGVELVLASCEPCDYRFFVADEWPFDVSLNAGRYWLEVNAPADFVGSVYVDIYR